MAEISRAAKVGVMSVLLAGAAVIGYRFVSRNSAVGGGYRVWAFLPDVTGIPPKSRVMTSGIQVGIVEEIRLDEATGKVCERAGYIGKDRCPMARVTIKMKPDVPL